MASPTLSTEGIVLSRDLTGESWLRLQVFSEEHGILSCLKRASTRKATSPAPDLFDDLSLDLETSNQGRTWFVRNLEIKRHRPGLALHYDGFRYACQFARLLVANPVEEDSRAGLDNLLHQALENWEQGQRPEIVYLKCLFVLARDEGYPVREDWLQNLPGSDREMVARILKTPLAEQTCPTPLVESYASRLENYLEHYTEIRFPR